MPVCSVIIPVHNRASLTRQCLNGLFATLPHALDVEVIVVDDGSTDATSHVLAAYADRIRIIRHDRSLGLAAACNDGAAVATGDSLIFLHNDTVPLAGWLDALLRCAAAHPDTAVVGSKLLFPNNTVQHAGIVIAEDRTPIPVYAGFSPINPAVNISRDYQAVSAAGALFRRLPFIEVAGFDSAFTGNLADIDLCLRLGELGYGVRYCHESVLFHFHSPAGAHADNEPDPRLFRGRWAHRLVQDDVRYYVEDGLLRVSYDATGGVHCTISPLLDGHIGDEYEREVKQLLSARSGQVFELLQENIRLVAELENRDFQDVSLTKLRAFLDTNQRMAFPPTEHPQVSIVIPTYNRAEQTYGALESLLAHQGESPFEVIIVDNQSTDESARLFARLDQVRVHRNEENRGFGDACNRGAAMARGAYVCFLNSDTLVTHGWLDALVGELAGDPQCGAAGARLIHPNGRLQEAGSIVWRDGSALGYGRGGDPFAPEYCYARPVDFCSAACLVMRRELFTRLGGFDPRYGMGYYEDTDLCMSVWAAGYTVRYVPHAVVFHLEHASSNKARAGELMERNRAVLMEKWQDRLATHGVLQPLDILRGRDTRPGKRLLVLDDVVPMARFGSGFPRTFALLNTLADIGYVITYLPLSDRTPYEPRTTELQARGIEVLHSVPDIEAKLRERAGFYEIVIISRPHHAPFIDVVRRHNPRATIIYDAEAVASLREIEQASIDGITLSAREIEARVRSELAPVRSANLVLTVSEVERRTIQRYYPQASVSVWGDALPIHHAETEYAARRDLLFFGFLGSAPNDDAIRYLLREIFPQVRARLDCRLMLAGMGATADAQEAAEPFGEAVAMLGFVEDLTALCDQSRVFVASPRFAAGIPLKVLEAMAHGLPCVISQLLGDQLGVTDGHEAFVATDPDDFAEKIVRLYQDEEVWRQMQQAAWRYLRDHYDPVMMRERLERSITDAVVSNQSSSRRAAASSGVRVLS